MQDENAETTEQQPETAAETPAETTADRLVRQGGCKYAPLKPDSGEGESAEPKPSGSTE